MSFPTKIIDISTGANHSAAVDTNGAMYTWGHGGTWMKGGGQLGHNSRDSEVYPRYVEVLYK
jgi:alpha-tubulin suppressor-like RCC1 family protein